jgi:uncharacterized Zn-binding protein involved in type VI secretion
MPGFMLHLGATVVCSHGGPAQPVASNARVLLSGQPAVTIATHYAVTGCALLPPPASTGPCQTAQFVTGASRVTIAGQPALLQDSRSICAPSGAPLLVSTTQTRVTAI